MNTTSSFLLVSVACTSALACQDSKPATTPVYTTNVTPAATPSPLYDFEVTRMDGTKTKLRAYEGKVLLLVNTASQCGLTPQYEGLQKLQDTYGDKGFTVLAFPANNFGQQEPGTNDEIAKFCKDKYAVTFPVFAKISVKGEDQAPLYKWLTKESGFAGEVGWNFQKYVVDRTGQLVARFDPRTKPQDAKLTEIIDAALNKTTPNKTAVASTTRPCSSTTSAALPGQGAANPQGLIAKSGLLIRMPPEISVPPE